MSESIELVAEYLAAALTCLVLILFVRHSRRFGVEHQQGWLAISIGFSLLLFGTLVEIALDYPELRALFPPSNTWTALLFELTLSGQLLAVVFLAFGFRRWMPALRALHDAQQSLREHHEVLEQRVEERTEELAEANQRIRAESAGQQRIASELRESQRRLETLLGNLPGMAYRGRCELWRPMEFVSDGCVELTGYPAEVLVGGEVVSFGALIHDDDREPVQRLIGQALERGDRFQLEYRLHTAQGRERVVWEQGAGVYDDAGELLAIEGLVVDITQRKRVEDRLRLASLIIDNALEGIVVTDPSGEIMMVNPAFTAITGYSAEEAIGRTPALLKSGRHDGPFYRRMWHEITTHGTWRGEIWNRRKNGEIYPQWLTVTAIRGHAGAIHQLIGIFSDITQRKLTEEHLKHLAHHDLLTGLPNRVLYLDRLQQQIRLARRDRRELAVLFLDLDEFKPINDRYGHDVGDQVLREVAERLSECVRSADTVARIGGDEFTIVVGPLDTAGDATIVARKILESVARPFLVDRHSHQIGVSIGIALYPQDASDAEGLTRRADAAMYVAKSCGRNTVRYYEPDRADGSEERFTDGTEAGAGDAVEPH